MHANATKHYIRTMRRYLRRNPGRSVVITRSNGERAGVLYQESTGRLAFGSAQMGEAAINKGLAIILGLANAKFFGDQTRIMLRLCQEQRAKSPSRLPG